MLLCIHDETKIPHLSLNTSKPTYISRQAILFKKMLLKLFRNYRDKWVLFEDSQVLDADDNSHALVERVRKAVGNNNVLIQEVEPISTRF